MAAKSSFFVTFYGQNVFYISVETHSLQYVVLRRQMWEQI